MLQLSEGELRLKAFLESAEGAQALEHLREEFYDVPSFSPDPYEMARIGGERGVIEYFIELAED